MFNNIARIALIAAALLNSGCAFWRPDKIHYTATDNTTPVVRSEVAPSSDGSEFIGVALSGGGARASVFGAAAIEALAEAGVMDRVTHVSSVSGGGFPAVYYALHKPSPCEPSSNTAPCRNEDFAAFKEAMTHNFLRDLTFRQFLKPGRLTSPTRRLSSLQDALDDQFIDGARFGDLPASPVLLINGARYDDARRFVFSTLPIPEEESVTPPFTQKTLRTASFSLEGCARPTPADFPVALAVAVSAGFPPLLGPAAIEASDSCHGGETRYWHLGDGGILDNTGVETLQDVALHASGDNNPAKRVIIFSFDAGKSAAPEIMMKTRNLKLWTSDPGRVVDIVGKRAEAYREVALDDGFESAGVSFLVLKMRYTDAIIDEWPKSCGKRRGGAEAISAHLATIPTNFKISKCDAALMELAARDVVRRTLNERRTDIEDAGLTLPSH